MEVQLSYLNFELYCLSFSVFMSIFPSGLYHVLFSATAWCHGFLISCSSMAGWYMRFPDVFFFKCLCSDQIVRVSLVSYYRIFSFLCFHFHFLCTCLGLEIKESRINSMRAAVSETFPEPNRRLLQRLVYFSFTGICFVFEFAFTLWYVILNSTF